MRRGDRIKNRRDKGILATKTPIQRKIRIKIEIISILSREHRPKEKLFLVYRGTQGLVSELSERRFYSEQRDYSSLIPIIVTQ